MLKAMFSGARRAAGQSLSAAQRQFFHSVLNIDRNQVTRGRRTFSRKWYGMLFICVTLLALDSAINTFPFSESTRSIVNGTCLAVLAVVGIWAFISYIQEPQKKPSVAQIFVWARLTYAEAGNWLQCGKDQKPPVNFEKHQLKTSGAKPITPIVNSMVQPIADSNQQSTVQAVTVEAICREDCDIEQGIPATGSQEHDITSQMQPAETREATAMRADIISEHINDVKAMDDTEDPPMCADRICQHSGDVEQGSMSNCNSDLGPDMQLSPRSSAAGSTTTLSCPVCLDDMKDSGVIALLRCGHLFCEECLKSWAPKSISCPFCRASMLEN